MKHPPSTIIGTVGQFVITWRFIFFGKCSSKPVAEVARLRWFGRILANPATSAVSRRWFEVPIPLDEGFVLLGEDHKSLFMTWLGEHGSSVIKVARAYTLASDE